MALSASTMAFSWSKWNSEVQDKDRIVVQASEHLKDEALLEVQFVWCVCVFSISVCVGVGACVHVQKQLY